jgi:large subunit ribosomal protein L4
VLIMNKIKQDQLSQRSQCIAMTFDDLGLPQGGTIYAPDSVSNYARALLQNWRQGTVWSRGRADVSFSNKKPWKQKGTGRARAGSPKSPLWRGGGVIFGPQERIRYLKTNKKARQLAMLSVLSNSLNNGSIFITDWMAQTEQPKTTHAHALLQQHGFLGNKVTVFVAPGDMLTYASFANIPNVAVMSFDQPNVFDLMNSKQWLIFKKDQDLFKQMVVQWL